MMSLSSEVAGRDSRIKGRLRSGCASFVPPSAAPRARLLWVRLLPWRALLLPCWGNILLIHSEAVERMSGRKPTFLLAPGGVQSRPATVVESLVEFGKDPGCRRAGGAFGGAGSR